MNQRKRIEPSRLDGCAVRVAGVLLIAVSIVGLAPGISRVESLAATMIGGSIALLAILVGRLGQRGRDTVGALLIALIFVTVVLPWMRSVVVGCLGTLMLAIGARPIWKD